jgi:hypothetical protein
MISHLITHQLILTPDDWGTSVLTPIYGIISNKIWYLPIYGGINQRKFWLKNHTSLQFISQFWYILMASFQNKWVTMNIIHIICIAHFTTRLPLKVSNDYIIPLPFSYIFPTSC